MQLDYRTVRQDAVAEMIEKKSRFLGHCRPVKTEAEALGFIAEIRSRHPQATHNVYAYLLRENNLMRYSDDGEPSGTAGVPVLEVLRKENLTDVAVVVTRYFGGVLLGAGGLVRAYGKSAHLGVDAAVRVEMRLCKLYALRMDYAMHAKMQYAVLEGGYMLCDTQFTDAVEMTVCVADDAAEAFEKMVVETSFGAVTPKLIGTDFVEVEL